MEQEGSEPLAITPAVTARSRRRRAPKGDGLWLMSFSDMSLILMSFFVLQLSFSTPDRSKYDSLSRALQKQAATPAAAPLMHKGRLQGLAVKLQQMIASQHMHGVTAVVTEGEDLAIEFKDQSLFPPGSAQPSPESKDGVKSVFAVLAGAPPEYRLVFEGYTDDVPMANARFRSNWELSAARGIALLNDFKALGVGEERMAVQAYAQTRPKVETHGLRGAALSRARAANRRVVIRLEASGKGS